MAPSPVDNQPAGDDYFNDLSQQPEPVQEPENVNNDGQQNEQANGLTNEEVPKPKRIACILCRKRKLKCDGVKPACGTCKRLQHDCSYDTVRKKSGPKRGYVAALEARLAQVETLLKTQDDRPKEGNAQEGGKDQNATSPPVPSSNETPGNDVQANDTFTNEWEALGQAPFQSDSMLNGSSGSGQQQDESFQWEMIGLGLDEPLPPQDIIKDLNQIYFDKIHPSMAMIHRSRYHAAMNLSPHMRPPVCLRYAMWANAAAVTDRYEALQEHFYERARRYIQQDEMKGHGEHMITVAHCQAWCLIATYEFKLMYFPRAWVSAGRACRFAQMMGMHRLDGVGLDVKQCLPPPRDNIEKEERRRTFWMCFCVDRYSSIGTGWPMTIEEEDIMTHLPCDEDSYDMNKTWTSITLEDALKPEGAPHLSGFAGVIVMACMFGRNLTHLHRPGSDDKEDDLNGEFWRRHRDLDNILLNTALALPEDCRLPAGLNNPNIVFMNMNIHTSTICLHQAAIFKADKNRMPARISAESKVRCITAAAEIAAIMRSVSHLDLSAMNPFISFCLYVAARVFVQYLKSRPHDAQVKSSLHFLLQAMNVIKRKNPLTESFLVQLDVDLEGAGLEDTRAMRAQGQGQPNPAAERYKHPGGSNSAFESARKKFHATFGDLGVSKYNDPANANLSLPQTSNDPVAQFVRDQRRQQRQTPQRQETSPLDANPFNARDMGYGLGLNQFPLPNRQRTPGSTPQLNSALSARSPPDAAGSMDCSPDGSAGCSGEQGRTPGSTGGFSTSGLHASSHSSNTSYSPRNPLEQMQQAQQQSSQAGQIWDASLFDPNNPSSFTTDFDMHNFPANGSNTQQAGFVLPQDWSSNNDTGGGTNTQSMPDLMASTTGMTPGSMNEVMNMSEQDWNQVFDDFNNPSNTGVVDWEGGIGNGSSRPWS
ncbi:hypothetical protein K431DRAFT_315679 [Polychaeton citri CBS 116435]|uniref:Zn(2)-C6 fungal-type domain-containing protein n=1 Tax=Polychaeton citri CBS 116435 TaxID=1314669 RepID=A0A9P4PZ22_9PEZI|nr:hypothetical protein K431DRAFT_315679 [Polychaeton citri CBS 116435]